jgi:hypothetical protein
MLPSDGRARLIFAWRGPFGHINRRWACEIDDVPTVHHLLRSQHDVYETQWWMNGPRQRYAFALAGTHAYTDLDTYTVPRFRGRRPEAIGKAVLRYCDTEGIPRPSAIVCSGRGLYPKWCFSEPVGNEHVGTMVAVNRALQRALAGFGADPKATDVTRLLRVTGSWHSGARRMVEVLHLEQRDGRTITYDPHALANQLVPRVAAPPASDMILPQPAKLTHEAPRDHVLRNHRFTREGWHWAIAHDIRRLAELRYRGGIVPEGNRDIFAFLIACQMLRIFPPTQAFAETGAFVSTMIEPGFLRRELAHLTSTAMRLARDAFAGRNWVQTYRHGKQTLIELLEITPAEMVEMRALISEEEHTRRERDRRRRERREAGIVERSAWLAANNVSASRPWEAEGMSRPTWYRQRNVRQV